MDNTWIEVKNAVNRLNNRLRVKAGREEMSLDYVSDICNNSLPHAINQVMALAFVHGVRRTDKDAKIIINGYGQLQTNGHIHHISECVDEYED